jgi:hypothetical protein
VRDITENWIVKYNEQMPYESLGNLTPMVWLWSYNNEHSNMGIGETISAMKLEQAA